MIRKIASVFFIIIVSLFFFLSVAFAQEQGKNPLAYKNKVMGIEITGPEGWYMHETHDILPGDKPERLLGNLVLFTSVPWGSKVNSKDGAIISLATDPVSNINGKILHGNTPLEYANYLVKVIKDMNGMMDIKAVKIIEEPVVVKINSLEGVRFTYEDDIEGTVSRSLKYIFMKGDFFYSLEYSSREEYFDKRVKEFEGVVNTFVLK